MLTPAQLHPLRALLAERMTRQRHHRSGSSKHPLFARMARDGIVVVPNLRNLTSGIAEIKQGLSSMLAPEPPSLATRSDSFLGQLFGMASGYKQLDLDVRRSLCFHHVESC